MAASGETSWPPVGTFLAVYGEILMAADSADRLGLHADDRSCHSRATSKGQSRSPADNHGHICTTDELAVLAGPARTHPANVPDKDEVGGSSPPRPTIRPLTSRNAVRSPGLSRLPWISTESTGV